MSKPDGVPERIHDAPTAIVDATGHAHHCEIAGCRRGPGVHDCHNPTCWKRKDDQRVARMRICGAPTEEPQGVVAGEIHLVPTTGTCAVAGHRWTRWLPVEGDLVKDPVTRITFTYERSCYALGCSVRQLAQNLRVDGDLKEVPK